MRPTGKSSGESGDDEEVLRQLVRELARTWSEAWTSKSTRAAAKFYSKTPGLVFFDMRPTHIGWDQYRKNIEKSFDSIDSLRLTLNNDLRVRAKEGMALTTATGHMSSKGKDGRLFDSNIRFTGVWEKKEGTWRLIHDHWSPDRTQSSG